MLRAAAAGHSHLHVSTLAPRESIALGAFHRRPEESKEVAVWRRHTGGRALPTGEGFLLVTLTLPHRSALTSDDRLALAPEQVMNRCVRGVLQALRSIDRELLHAMYRASGKPIELNILTPTPQHPMGWQNALEFCRESFAQGIRLHPQFTTNKLELHLKLADTFVFDEMPVWREVLTTPEPERSKRLADRSMRSSHAAKRRAT